MKAQGHIALLFLCFAPLASSRAPGTAFKSAANQPTPLVFTHVTVIDATGKPAVPDRTVILDGDHIQSIGKSSEARAPRNARVIDASGKYMIPGLWDMHMHFRGGPGLNPRQRGMALDLPCERHHRGS